MTIRRISWDFETEEVRRITYSEKKKKTNSVKINSITMSVRFDKTICRNLMDRMVQVYSLRDE